MHPVVLLLLPVTAFAALLFAATLYGSLHPDQPEPRPRKAPPKKKPQVKAPAATALAPAKAAQAPAKAADAPQAAAPATAPRPAYVGNNAFAGETVAFTGKLEGMTREEAIRAVVANGGRAFASMPAGTTILVVGDKPGMGKLDKADRWIGQTRKITQREFMAMLSAPLTVTPDQFAAAFAAGREV